MTTMNVRQAIEEAWEYLWRDNLRRRAAGETYRHSETYYLTASDVENQVRQFAEEQATGKARGSTGRAYGRGWSSVRVAVGGGGLKNHVRDWLLDQVRIGRLEVHNFGRSHISGARFRPTGEPISDTEKRTVALKKRRNATPRPTHWSGGSGHLPACTAKRRNRYSRGRSQAWATSRRGEVTCPRCLNLMTENGGHSHDA